MSSVSSQGNTPPIVLTHKELSQRVCEEAIDSAFSEEPSLPLTFAATAAGMDRETFESWTDLSAHHAFGCSKAAMYANWTRQYLIEFMKIFSKLIRGMPDSPLLREAKSMLGETYSVARKSSARALDMRGKLRSFLIQIMDRTGSRPIDDRLSLVENPTN
ncbi:MAG: hypothetical protein OXU45_01640 [Candidatus Melainabacteria bacterium]|nr:hypothetical protein [Candidatus Melainabacteria bacterium]